jgi:hypothetical protein
MVYLAADDSIVATGTAKECAKQMGLKNEGCFRRIVSMVRHGQHPKYEVIVSDTDTLDDDADAEDDGE